MATYFFRNAGVNWGTASNWSLTDGGGATGAVPTSADDALFSNNSGPCTVDTNQKVCKTLDFTRGTGYTNTITMTNSIVISGSVTLNAAMGVAGSQGLLVNATATLTSNGFVWPNSFEMRATATFTLADDWAITGLLTFGVGTNTVAGGKTITVAGGLTVNTTTSMTGTILMTGGTWSGAAQIGLTELKFQGNISISSGTKFVGTTMTYISGTVTHSGTLNLSNATMNTNGITWVNITCVTNQTWTLSSDLVMSGNLTGLGANTLAINGAFNCKVGGNLTLTGGNWTGTAKIVLNGSTSQTWSGTGTLGINMDFNATGTIVVSGSVDYGIKTLKYVAGTMTVTGSTLNIPTASSCTLDTNGMTWNNVTQNGTSAITLSSDLSLGTNSTFTYAGGASGATNGAFNINCAKNFTNSSSMSGTATIVMTGTGNLTGGTMAVNCTINTAGTITMVGTWTYNTKTITYVAGTFNANSQTLTIGANTTLNTSGINWFNILVNAGSWTLTSDLTVTNNYTVATNTTQNGVHNTTCKNYSNQTVSVSITYVSGCIITITNSLVLTGTVASNLILKSGTATSAVFFNLNYGATQDVSHVTATDIDSSGGQTIWDFKGALTRTVNWNLLVAPPTNVCRTFVV